MTDAHPRFGPAILAWLATSILAATACGSADATTTAAEDSGSTAIGDADATTGDADAFTSDAGTDEPAASETSGTPSDSSTATDGGTGVDMACDDAPLPPGLHTDLELELDGLTRTYDLFVPSSADEGAPVTLVINMHGWGSSKEQQAELSQMSDDAELRGYAVAYLQGYEDSFNSGFCCGAASSDDIDDVAFAVAVVDDADSRGCLDRARVYATGFSNGGFMAYRLACEAAETFAAVAPVAGVLSIDLETCSPARPVSVLHFHGMDDFNVRYEGRPWLGVPGVPELMELFAAHDGCAAEPVVTFEQDDVVCETWPGCTDGTQVGVCRIEGAGHCWPGNPECTYGDSTTTISANARMFDAFDLIDRSTTPR